MKEQEKILKALANKRRLQIIKYLKNKKEATVGEIADHLKLSFKSSSKHLLMLMHTNIVEKEQRSLSAFYSLSSHYPPIIRSIIMNL